MSESIKEQLQLALNELDEAISTQGYENIDEHIHGAQERIEAAMEQLDDVDKVITALMVAVEMLAGVAPATAKKILRRKKEIEAALNEED